MRIFNVRLGHATNSSSAHSVVVGHDLRQDVGPKSGPLDFGWDDFVLVSRGAKVRYLFAAIARNLKRVVGSHLALATARGLFPEVEVVPDGDDVDLDCYIDHQSCPTFPCDRQRFIDRQFLAEFMDFVLRDDVAVLGGSDEYDDAFGAVRGRRFKIPFCDEHPGFRCREDDGWWSLYNPTTGTKIRLCVREMEIRSPRRSRVPELVDLRITSRCDLHCPWCAGSCSPDGLHADRDYVNKLLEALGYLGCFEVAVGGGAAEEHPALVEFLRRARGCGMTPNLSLAGRGWTTMGAVRAAIADYCGAIAISVRSAEEAVTAENDLKDLEDVGLSWDRCALHVVLGVSTLDDLGAILGATSWVRLVLLGYKRVGRGLLYRPADYAGWDRVVAAVRAKGALPPIAIDTALAAQSADELWRLGVSPLLYTTEEGRFSMYVDAVGKRCAPSSYCDEADYIPLPDPSSEKLLAAFNQIADRVAGGEPKSDNRPKGQVDGQVIGQTG